MQWLVWIAIGAATIGFDSKEELAKRDRAQLQGEWSMVSGEIDGQAMPEDFRVGFKRVAKDDVTTVTSNGQMFMKAKFTLDPTKKPKTIDYSVLDGPAKGKKQLGIYELEGDTVRFCFASPGKDRPTEFSALPDSGHTLSKWKRVKK